MIQSLDQQGFNVIVVQTVKNNLARVFRLDKKRIDALFSGEKTVVKKDASRDLCKKTKKFFNAAGAVVSAVPLGTREEPPPLSPESKQEAAAPVKKKTLLLLTFFLGWFGIYKFYLSRYIKSMLYFLLCWTFFPSSSTKLS